MGLDSVYAMTATPAKAEIEHKRKVDQVKKSDAVHADSHETPQSQLPPNLERRHPKEDRRQSKGDGQKPRVERRQLKGRRGNEQQPKPQEDSKHLVDIMA